MKSEICHRIKHEKKGNNKIVTPENLAKNCIEMIKIKKEDILMDGFAGKDKVWYRNFPKENKKIWREIDEKKDFFDYKKKVDIILSNPPYDILDSIFEHSCIIAEKGFGYLIGINNLTPRRIENCNKMGFGISKFHLCKVFKYFGMSIFVYFEKGKKNIIGYDRTVWRA